MADIIQLLPDAVANQIAAGEVIQRPASVVKELVENAIDAGAKNIKVNIKDAGRTLIQIVDDGRGMSVTDARMAFERHATSKIRNADDLFAINTLGFRGEALASIAAVAEVELKTKVADSELGTIINISASSVTNQEAGNCPAGSNFSVKNLFFNVPARRKFLKSNSTEFKHIINEVQRVALCNPDIAFSLYHNNCAVYEMKQENLRKRIVNIFGKNINQSLIPVNTDTSIIKIFGYTGQPKFARKSYGEQFFFVNGRYMKHSYFHKAVLRAYEKILPPDTFPSYFLYFKIDSSSIDINIHPTKTEIKFEDEQAIWQIIQACIRESLGKFNIVPSIDFNQAGAIEIPVAPNEHSVVLRPELTFGHSYNPFEEEKKRASSGGSSSLTVRNDKSNLRNLEKLYDGSEDNIEHEAKAVAPGNSTGKEFEQQSFNDGTFVDTGRNFMQVKNRYILSPVKSGIMIIDQRRAHERILYENFMRIIDNNLDVSQRQLFPAKLELSADDAEILSVLIDDLKRLGFDIRVVSDNGYYIDSLPGVLSHFDAAGLVERIINDFKQRPVDVKEEVREHLAAILAKESAIDYGTLLKQEEIEELFDNLFACNNHNFSPSGKNILTIMKTGELEKMLK